MKKKLTVIMFSYNKEKLNYGLSIICAAAAIDRPTELFFAGKNIFNILTFDYLKEINKKSFLSFSNSEELLISSMKLGTQFSVCSAAIDDNKIDIKFIRSDLEISISGLVSIVSEELKSNELLFI